MKTTALFKTILFALLFMLIGGQWAWADGPLSKKDSLELVKAIQEYKKSEKKAYDELDNKLKKETNAEQAEMLSNNTDMETDKLLVNFISNHPKLMDFPDNTLEELLDIDIITSPDRRIRYYSWVLSENEKYDEVSRVMQYRTDDGKIETCWDIPFYDEAMLPWSYAFTPTEIYTLNNHGKRIYLVKEFILDDAFTYEQIRAIAIDKGKVTKIPMFDSEDIIGLNNINIYANDLYPNDLSHEKPSSIIGFSFGTNIFDDDFEPTLTYDPSMREIHFDLSSDEPYKSQKHFKFDDKSNTFVLRTFPPTTDTTEIAVGQRVKAIMEDALDRFNQVDALLSSDEENNEKESEKVWERVNQLDNDYCSESWKETMSKVNTLTTQNEDYFPDSGIWLSGQEFSDGPNMKLLCIDKIQKIDNNTYLVFYTFKRYKYENLYETASLTMVCERDNWYVDDFEQGIYEEGWKKQLQNYINETLK